MKILSLPIVLSGRFAAAAAFATLVACACLPLAYAQSVEESTTVAPSLQNDVLPNLPNYSSKGRQPDAPVVSAVSPAQLHFTITFNDPSHTYASYYSAITAAFNAAGAE